ncbi:MAG: hypothetical protein RL685_5073 [Pseudomonadota bacterium]|jgi:sugar O-acyltransferase (sialic acid O-acetyltransferase NeuD family)
MHLQVTSGCSSKRVLRFLSRYAKVSEPAGATRASKRRAASGHAQRRELAFGPDIRLEPFVAVGAERRGPNARKEGIFGLNESASLLPWRRLTRVVVFGAGGHGRVVADAARCAGAEVLGFLDDRRAVGDEVSLGRVLGGRGWWRAHPDVAIALGIGANDLRKELAAELEADGMAPATVIHPSAVVARTARVDSGAVVLALAVINPDAHVGAGAIVNSGAVVEHDVCVGSYAHVSPRAVLAGSARLGELSQLGASACILPGVSVGPRCLVGAGAVVTRDIPGDCICMGVPARVTRHVLG